MPILYITFLYSIVGTKSLLFIKEINKKIKRVCKVTK